jgi:hypothetical protein
MLAGMRFTSCVAVLLAFLPSCGPGEPPAPPFRPECENVGELECLLPWPSSRYLVDDATTLTGRRIQIPVEAMPTTRRGAVPVSPELFERFDGFSPSTSIVTAFPGEIDASNLPDEVHIDDSLDPTSPTVLIDAETNMRVAHFAELDMWGDIEPERRPFYIRPASRLLEDHRYIVAIRDVRRMDGTDVEPTPYFRALRDDAPLPGTDVEERRADFEDVFMHLEAAGVARDSLIQAWDFETASGEVAWGDVVTMRDEALRRVQADTMPPCTVTDVEDMPDGTTDGLIWRRVHGTVRVPLFLAGVDPADFDAGRIQRAADGTPTVTGFADVPWVVNIPRTVQTSVAGGGPAGRLLDYGHGLFGDRFETDSGWFRNTISQLEIVSVAVDWWGMSSDDAERVVRTLQEFSTFATTSERLQQGLVNHVVLHRSFMGACADLPELQIPVTAGGTARSYDPSAVYYYGNSQGGIMGLALAGIAVDVDRFVLGVGGSTYSVMIPRSVNWQTYGAFMRVGYADPLERAMIMTMGQSQWDLGEPSTFASHVTSDPLPCATDVCPSGSTPLKRVLYQIGRDDAQVPNISSDIAVRQLGIPYLSPSPYVPWQVPMVTAATGESAAESAFVIYQIPGVAPLPLGTRDPMMDNDAHEGVRRSPAAIEQIGRFLEPDGTVFQTCDGICDPT